jgi:subtilisin family serine protease
VGEWVVAIGDAQRVTFTANLQTRFLPELATAYAVGRWVEVKVVRAPGGDYIAQRVRVDDYEVGEIVVRLESAAYSQTIAAEYGLVLTSTLLTRANIYLYTTRNENEQLLAKAIEADERVVWAEVNYVNSVPEDDGYKTWGWGGSIEPDAYTSQSAYQQIRMGNASRVYQGNGVVVAVLDTGIYTPHEQFEGRLRLPSLDVIDDDSDPSEAGPGAAWGHGTHVAGVVAAMAPQAVILPVRVLDENGRGNTFLLAYAIEWVTQQPNVKVINLSLGTDFDSKILREVIANATAQGMIVVAAAGNSGTSKVQYPAGYHDVVGVTAVDGNSIKADFANYGVGWIDVAAPGVAIMSTMINDQGAGYATWSGTSMATAFVSGASALVAEKWDVESAHDGALLAQLVETGLVLDALNPTYAGQIGRQLDVSAALEVKAALLYVPQTAKD